MKIGTDKNGHPTIDGGRWHRPDKDDPTKCGVKGCTHQMGTLRRQPWQDEKKDPDTGPMFRRRSKRS